jgi:hypothetical protein
VYKRVKEALSQATRELNDKPFSCDPDGNIIAVQPIQPKRLPPYALTLSVSVTSPQRDPKAEDTRGAKRIGTTKAGSKHDGTLSKEVGSGALVAAAAHPPTLSSFVIKEHSLRGSVTQSLTLSAGVTLTDGKTINEGPLRQEDPLRPSRKAFAFAQHSQSLSNSEGGFRTPAASPHNHIHRQIDNQGEMNEDEQPWRFPELQITAGGRRVTEDARLPEDSEPHPDDELMKSPLWGTAPVVAIAGSTQLPPPVPTKGSAKQRKLKETRNPRDRVNPKLRKNTAEASRLPAPPVGFTTGHGLFTPHLNDAAIEALSAHTSEASQKSARSIASGVIRPTDAGLVRAALS